MLKIFLNYLTDGLQEIYHAVKDYNLMLALGRQDVTTRYRRSRIGAFWLTINMIVTIMVLGFVFGGIFKQSINNFLPYLTVGLVLWGFISNSINEGCASFSSSSDIILQVRMSFFIHIVRVLWRNLIILFHNLLIIPIVFIIFSKSLSIDSLLSIPALFLILMNLAWMSLLLAIICTRFRDVGHIVQNIMQVTFFVTPIFWEAKSVMGDFVEIINLVNPFYHMVNIFRAPLLGLDSDIFSWIFCAIFFLVGSILSLYFLGKYQKRITYWL